jgi:hypothetical protein
MCIRIAIRETHYGQQRVGLGDSFIFPEPLDECMRLGGITAAEDRPSPLVD